MQSEISKQNSEGLVKGGNVSKFKVNHYFLFLYVMTISMNGFVDSWTNGGYNQTASIICAKLNWTAAESRFNNSMINFAA